MNELVPYKALNEMSSLYMPQTDSANSFMDYTKLDKDLFVSKSIPLTYDQAMSGTLLSKWHGPIQKELETLNDHSV